MVQHSSFLIFGSPGWWVPAVGVVLIGLVTIWWGYRRTSFGGVARVVAGLLKVAAFVLLALCLTEPLWSGTRPRPGANFFVLLADNSQGMTIRDHSSGQSWGEKFKVELTRDQEQLTQSAWQVRLDQDFEVRRYLFDSRLRRTDDFGPLEFDGRSSSLAEALRTIGDRYRGQPLAGVLLFSDGNATDAKESIFQQSSSGPMGMTIDPAGLPPVYPVVVGQSEPAKDLAIAKVTISQSSFEDAPVTIQADVFADGYVDSDLVVQLFDEKNEKIQEHQQPVIKENEKLSYRFMLRPEKPGISFYSLQVSASSELGQFDRPEESAEATLVNNRRLLVVDRGQGPYRILYVAGRPNWEFKFLRRALEEDEQIDLVGLIRIARREPKFDWRGRVGESSNPLFRGFKDSDEEEDAERYDQPVFVRLNTIDEYELQGGFPKTAEELFRYHAVVLDDLDSKFFDHDQMTLLKAFVSERGGGLLMLGGQESFREGKFHRTPIGEMLPVYLDRTVEEGLGEKFELTLTREGWLQPWVRLRSNEIDELDRLEEMPNFRTINRIRGIKPGARVLANVTGRSGTTYPALVVERFGRGRTAALTIGDLWRWGLRSVETAEDLAKAWRQTMRWLVTDVPDRFEISALERSRGPEQPIRLEVRVMNKEFDPVDGAHVVITVELPSTEKIRLQADPSLTEAGLYEATYLPRQEGAYRAEAVVTDENDEEIASIRTGWVSDPAAEEFRFLRPNRRLLEELAEKTGGEVINIKNIEKFVASLPNRKIPITEPWTYPLWHLPTVFLLAMGCLVGEWGLRRWKGLA